MTDQNLPILWTFRRCPYAMRTRLAIKRSGISVYLREILLQDKPPEFIEDSEKATVPVLKLPDGKILEESLDIMRWALKQSDPDDWCQVLVAEADYSKAFLTELDGTFKDALDRYKYASRYALNGDAVLRHRSIGTAFLQRINERLDEHPFVSGQKQGFLDIASLPFVRQFRIADPTWFDRQNWALLHVWLQQFIESEQFAVIMQKLKPWDSQQGEGIFF
ncbi:MAG: glutathione S-transferase N-terminal domain-containing protein [Proteobacteria bacterium]|nr:glutathione S-transferase N-terminal domain-containing protein [Pseudomonadota bacterium]MDA1331798.1 glutathione S-transferase N-terminal domain-containing protein [Pseudomonadota bacterium]